MISKYSIQTKTFLAKKILEIFYKVIAKDLKFFLWNMNCTFLKKIILCKVSYRANSNFNPNSSQNELKLIFS
jgi:hypothetical protein